MFRPVHCARELDRHLMIRVNGRFRNLLLHGADRVLSAVVRPARAPQRPTAPRVLVIRCDHLGDATLATAALQDLRDTLAPSRLDVVCGPWASAIFEGHPAVDEVLPVAAPWWLVRDRVPPGVRLRSWFTLASFALNIRRRRYDVGVDLRGDLRHFVWFFGVGGIPERVSSDRTGGAVLLTSCAEHRDGVHEVERMRAIGATIGAAPDGRPILMPRTLSPARRTELGLPERFIAIAPRGASPNRQWPSAHVAELARLVHDQLGLPLVYLGSGLDRAHAAEAAVPGALISLAGQTSLEELIAILGEADLVVAMDSGPMHIAATLDRPIVALWGPGSMDMRPFTDRAIIVQSSPPCECTGRTCRFTEGAGRCYRALAPAQVFDALRSLQTSLPSAS